MTKEEIKSIAADTNIAAREVIPRVYPSKGLWVSHDETSGKADYTEKFTLELPARMEGHFRYSLIHTGYDPYNIYGNGANFNRADKDVMLGELSGEEGMVYVYHAEVENGDVKNIRVYSLDALIIRDGEPIEEYSFIAIPKADKENFKAIASIVISNYYEKIGKQFPVVELPDGNSKTLTDKSGFEIKCRISLKDENYYGERYKDKFVSYYGTKTGEVVRMESGESSFYECQHTFMTAEEAVEDIRQTLKECEKYGTVLSAKYVSEVKQKEYTD